MSVIFILCAVCVTEFGAKGDGVTDVWGQPPREVMVFDGCGLFSAN